MDTNQRRHMVWVVDHPRCDAQDDGLLQGRSLVCQVINSFGRASLVAAVMVGALLLPNALGIAAEKQDTSRAEREQPVPSWIYNGYLSVQAAEANILLRKGNATVETLRNVANRLDPKTAERLQKQGIHFVIAGGYSGAGLANERDVIEANKPLSAALKANGIRRVFYVQTIGNIFQEPFCAETPQAVNWVQRQPNGEVPYYYTQWFRQIPCINNDDFIAYAKNTLRTVMKELDLDGVFTDNYGYYSYTCYCECCQKKFREYLNHCYPDAASRAARFGTPAVFDFVKPPLFRDITHGFSHTLIPDSNLIVDPVTQEWVRFRCRRLGEVAREFNQVIKECNPQGAWFLNYLYGGTPGLNCAVFHGCWPAYVYPHADLISAEVCGPPSLSAGGVAQGRMLLMKVAKHFGIPLSTCHFNDVLANWRRLYLAEGMAFNAAPVDLSGDIWRDDPPPWMRDYLDFYQAQRKRMGRAATVADCAVLHNFETLSYCTTYPQESLVLCEQSLVQGGVTFDIVFDEDLDRLQDYRCLFLANVVALSRPAAEKIADYVRHGGSIVVTDDTSALNERMQPWKGEWLVPRKTHLLAELLGLGEQWPQSGSLVKEFGKGRVAVVPSVNRPWSARAARSQVNQEHCAKLSRSLASHSHGPAMPMILGAESLSPNHREILKAVDSALGGARTIRVEAPKEVISEVTQNSQGVFVHLLNWNEGQSVAEVKVSLLAPADRTIRKAELLSPDRQTPAASLPLRLKEGRIEFTVPDLLCYDVIVLN